MRNLGIIIFSAVVFVLFVGAIFMLLFVIPAYNKTATWRTTVVSVTVSDSAISAIDEYSISFTLADGKSVTAAWPAIDTRNVKHFEVGIEIFLVTMEMEDDTYTYTAAEKCQRK